MDLKEGTHIQEQAIYTVKNLENCDWKIVGVCYVDEMITEKGKQCSIQTSDRPVSGYGSSLSSRMGIFRTVLSTGKADLPMTCTGLKKMLKILYLSRWRELQRSRLYPTRLNTWL